MHNTGFAPIGLAVVFVVLLLLRKFRRRLFPTTPRRFFTMPIEAVLSPETAGNVVVEGTIAEGEIQVGDDLIIDTRYGRMRVHVEDVESDHRPVGRLTGMEPPVAGDRVKITLSGVHSDQVNVHDLLTDPKSRLKNTRTPRSGGKGASEQFFDPSRPNYLPGQVYTYRTRPGEKNSRLTIVKVEPHRAGMIVHIYISALAIRNPAAPDGVSTFISHMPFAEQALDHSVTQMVEQKTQLPSYEEGYADWKRQADQGKAGVFTIPVAQAIDGIEKAFEREAN